VQDWAVIGSKENQAPELSFFFRRSCMLRIFTG
jgi:hypothetical protein